MAGEHIPEHLGLEILVRLPAKSVVRFRSLSKDYNAVTRETSFISQHLSRSIVKAKNKPNFLVFHEMNKFLISLVSEDEQSQPPIDLKPPFIFLHANNIIPHAHCNGIIYIELFGVPRSPNPMILWNPATREVKFLPYPPPTYPGSFTLFHGAQGFGVDPKTNDYKVVSVEVDSELFLRRSPNLICQVYSLRSDSWKVVKGGGVRALYIYKSMFNACLNGAYHWLAACCLGNHVEFVLCFDMSDDVFWKMKLPQVLSTQEENNGSYLWNHNVVVLNGRIGYVREYVTINETQFKIWVMNEYGVEGSWVRMFTIERGAGIGKILEFWKGDNDDDDDGDVVLGGEEDDPLVLYKIGEEQVLKEFPVLLGVNHHALRYVESIVPLSGLVDEEA